MEDYYKQHPEEAEEMGAEGEAYDTGTRRMHSLEGGKQGVIKKKRKY